MDSKQKGFAIAALRRASYRWPARNEAMKKARVGKNQYECAVCKNIFPNRLVDKDHKEPIVPLSGWDGFDGYIERLLVQENGWQVLCKPCHREKTNDENKKRRENTKTTKDRKKTSKNK